MLKNGKGLVDRDPILSMEKDLPRMVRTQRVTGGRPLVNVHCSGSSSKLFVCEPCVEEYFSITILCSKTEEFCNMEIKFLEKKKSILVLMELFLPLLERQLDVD